MKRNEDRKHDADVRDFAQTPTVKKLIHGISLKSKKSIVSNIIKPAIHCDSLLSVIYPKDAVNNALMLDIDVAIIRANNVKEALLFVNHNCASDGHGVREYILSLAERCKGLNKEINMLIFSEFRDGFSPCASLTTKDSLVLHTITFKLIN